MYNGKPKLEVWRQNIYISNLVVRLRLVQLMQQLDFARFQECISRVLFCLCRTSQHVLWLHACQKTEIKSSGAILMLSY